MLCRCMWAGAPRKTQPGSSVLFLFTPPSYTASPFGATPPVHISCACLGREPKWRLCVKCTNAGHNSGQPLMSCEQRQLSTHTHTHTLTHTHTHTHTHLRSTFSELINGPPGSDSREAVPRRTNLRMHAVVQKSHLYGHPSGTRHCFLESLISKL